MRRRTSLQWLMLDDLVSSGGRDVWPLLREEFPTDDDLYGMLAARWVALVEEAFEKVTRGPMARHGEDARRAAYALARRRDPRLVALLEREASRPVVSAMSRRLAEQLTRRLAAAPPVTPVEAPALAVPRPRGPADGYVEELLPASNGRRFLHRR